MEYVEARRAAIEQRITEAVGGVEPTELGDQLEHVVLAGGKRVRPTLTVLVCEAAGGAVWTGAAEAAAVRENAALSAGGEDALDYAVGVELVHNASLVVDDIIDRSELRRGSASAWAEYGYGPGIVASDGLLGEAFALFSRDPRAMECVTDSLVELGEGEAIELVARPETEREYMELARRKTGALFRAAAELGAIAADADGRAVERFGEYAERVGVAFQIRDDVLDATADSDALGKPAGVDEALDRPSIVQVTDRSPDALNRLAGEQSERALGALAELELPDGEAKDYLQYLAEFVVERDA
ncbi:MULTISPECIES: polyprenyl synthetase family protein [Halobacterium]|uniref:Bifunctional short chain isoprenyl diphosphatesynthase n=3 Tax=Halobacterium salinarum TaxID=2242 RepID=Q9HND0_HALSA|nr:MULTISPECIES: polyprenyl synthetase family protein [Halobacterium]AAG20290.1 putative isopentenyl pyrophosphate isomerase [Halobacterium salinarum NRC-1]MBB6089308.1 geranylgeranyl diphosphate synthase type I [Halobacterium salinarum]MDL0119208.1 polyprenyl synthetase family protein [Halobacterium salinarum]MDL0127206.1 polyprenyl synthetase family protein [Halobacterium salinarum]MDL0130105.1 polyprenyl synthetase family protein [Halobacterium salinarum]